MAIVVLLVLAIIWAVVLIPPMRRARAEASPADSIVNFRRQLRVIQRTTPAGAQPVSAPRSTRLTAVGVERPRRTAARPVPAPPSMAERRARTVRRRRDVFFSLVMGMGTTFVLATVIGSGALWLLHLAIDALFVGYVALLIRLRNIAAEKEMKLLFLPSRPPRQDADLLLRRSAN